jgi:hypothetical protein
VISWVSAEAFMVLLNDMSVWPETSSQKPAVNRRKPQVMRMTVNLVRCIAVVVDAQTESMRKKLGKQRNFWCKPCTLQAWLRNKRISSECDVCVEVTNKEGPLFMRGCRRTARRLKVAWVASSETAFLYSKSWCIQTGKKRKRKDGCKEGLSYVRCILDCTMFSVWAGGGRDAFRNSNRR